MGTIPSWKRHPKKVYVQERSGGSWAHVFTEDGEPATIDVRIWPVRDQLVVGDLGIQHGQDFRMHSEYHEELKMGQRVISEDATEVWHITSVADPAGYRYASECNLVVKPTEGFAIA